MICIHKNLYGLANQPGEVRKIWFEIEPRMSFFCNFLMYKLCGSLDNNID